MESEKVKEIKKALECCTYKGCNHCSRLSKGYPIHLDDCRVNLLADILTLINELESENEALQKGVKRLKKRYNETITKNADECVKKFCETTMYHEQKKLVNENQQLKDQIADLEKQGKVIISKEEYERLKKQLKELEEQRDKQAYITEDLIQEKHLWTEQARKKTAREILERGKYCMPSGLKEWIIEQFGVEIGEENG